MYRDSSTALDEHDRAVGAILIGEALVQECERAWARSRDATGTTDRERWRAIAEIHDTLPEIWRHLDRARRVLAGRGANTAAYDEDRPHARRPATHGDDDSDESLDTAALDDAKRAIDELKLALPGADWDAIEARTRGLVSVPLARRSRQRLAVAGVLVAGAFAMLAWLLAMTPQPRPSRRAEMQSELRLIAQQRELRIVELRTGIGDRCAPADAHELMKLLVLDGRTAEASAFGHGYLARCGDDEVVAHWAAAPPPGH